MELDLAVVAGHRISILTCSSRRRNWQTSSPSGESFLELPTTRGRHRPRRSPNIANRPSSLCRTQSGAKNHRHRPTPKRNTIKNVLSPLLSDAISQILLSIRVSHLDFCFAGDLNSARQPFGLEGLSSTSESSVSVIDDDGGGGLRRLCAALPCGRGSRCRKLAGQKNTFRLPINNPFERELLGFEGEPVALEENFVVFFGFGSVR